MLVRNVGGGLAAAAMLVSALAATPAIAQVPKSFAPRMFSDQQTTYTRIAVPFNACAYTTVTPFTCAYKVGAVPINAFIVRGYYQVYAAFTGATTMTASIGTGNIASGNNTNIVNAQSIAAAGNAAALTIVTTGLGLGNPGVTGQIQPTGSSGGFDLWVTLSATGAAPSAGNAVLILEYIQPNDGACNPNVPQGTTFLAPC